MDEVQECKICGGEYADLLLHLRTAHDIDSGEDYEQKVAALHADLERQLSYRTFITELTKLRDEGKITAEEWRRRSEAWRQAP